MHLPRLVLTVNWRGNPILAIEVLTSFSFLNDQQIDKILTAYGEQYGFDRADLSSGGYVSMIPNPSAEVNSPHPVPKREDLLRIHADLQQAVEQLQRTMTRIA
jgi:hypothetical protein